MTDKYPKHTISQLMGAFEQGIAAFGLRIHQLGYAADHAVIVLGTLEVNNWLWIAALINRCVEQPTVAGESPMELLKVFAEFPRAAGLIPALLGIVERSAMTEMLTPKYAANLATLKDKLVVVVRTAEVTGLVAIHDRVWAEWGKLARGN